MDGLRDLDNQQRQLFDDDTLKDVLIIITLPEAAAPHKKQRLSSKDTGTTSAASAAPHEFHIRAHSSVLASASGLFRGIIAGQRALVQQQIVIENLNTQAGK